MNLKNTAIPDKDCYGFARLCQVIGNFFGGTLSVGINTVDKLDCDNWDNGVYIIEGWKIVDRKHFKGQEQMNYKLEDMLVQIDKCMPKEEQLGDYLKAKEIPINEVKVGDTVYIMDFDGKVLKHKVMGFGKDEYQNGTNVNGMPYVNLYKDSDGRYDWNINNYIRTKTVRVKKQ